jgi:hypothetical protein
LRRYYSCDAIILAAVAKMELKQALASQAEKETSAEVKIIYDIKKRETKPSVVKWSTNTNPVKLPENW